MTTYKNNVNLSRSIWEFSRSRIVVARRGAFAHREMSRRVIDHQAGWFQRICPLARKSDFKTTRRTIKALSLSPPTFSVVALLFSSVPRVTSWPESIDSRPPVLRVCVWGQPYDNYVLPSGACLGNSLTRPIAYGVTILDTIGNYLPLVPIWVCLP